MDRDYKLAKQLEKEFENDFKKKHSPDSKHKTTSLVDPQWEIVDPNPDIYSLFQTFNGKYFWNKLGSVEVKWSPRMYSCAGICTYKGRGGCIVSLSLPLLKLRPRKDLVETLLHEMIHAYLFLTKNNKDRDGHGPEFHSHMFRINKEAGTKITVYHSFHDEVRHYKTHWWRCDGPCQNERPFFGLVKRSMNRAPGPNDFWYADHQSRCGGNFIKIKEPDGFKARGPNKKKNGETTSMQKTNTVNSFISKNTPPQISKPGITNGILSRSSGNLKNVHGFGDLPMGQSTINGLTGLQKKSNTMDSFISKSPSPHTSRPAITNGNLNKSSGNLTNVRGFGDLPAGKGALTKTGGSFKGGTLNNKGGTLVVRPGTVPQGKTNEEVKKSPLKRPHSDFSPFSGTGHTLSNTKQLPDRSRSRLLSLYDNNSSKKMKLTDSISPIMKPKVNSSISRSGSFISSSKLPLERKTELNDSSSPVPKSKESPSTSNSKSLISNSKQLFDRSKSKLLNFFDKKPKKISLNSSTSSLPNTESSLDSSTSLSKFVVRCPVCDCQVEQSDLNEHLDSCAQLDSVFDKSVGIELLDDDSDVEVSPNSNPSVNCPVCNEKLPQDKLHEHLDSCAQLDIVINNSQIFDDNDDDENVCIVTSESLVHCPVCNKQVDQVKLNEHLDQCIVKEYSSSIEILDDSSFDSGQKNQVECPCCGIKCPIYEINKHIDQCAQ